MTASSNKRLDDTRVLLGILDNLPTSIFVKDEELRFVYSNDRHCDIIGKSEAELLGHSDADFWPEEQASGFKVDDDAVILGGEVRIREETATRKDGRTFPQLTRKARLKAADGKTYLIGTNSDVTEIKRREQKYRALADTVPVAVVQVDDAGRVSFANPLFLSYCGGDGSEMAQLQAIASLQEQHAGFPGAPCKFEADLKSADGERRVIAISSGWLKIEDDHRSAIISLIDISEMSELRRINEEVSRLNRELAANMKKLSEAQDELVKKGRMEQLGQLTATIAHELRNPLGSVRTSAFLLDRKLRDKELGIESQLDRINKGIVRCDNIITQLLDFSRTKQLKCQPGDLDNWLVQVMEEEAKKLPAAIAISCDLGLKGQMVPFDPGRLQRAIVNLLSNASEALVGQGDDPARFAGPEPRITVATRADGEGVSISVTDNGPGIPPDVLARIREPLYTTKSFGTGLGVPAIEQIAHQHGGTLTIQSQEGIGADFKVWLPLTRPDGSVSIHAA